MTGAIAAFRASSSRIVQVFEVGTATMMAAKGAIKTRLRADGGRR
jgi:sn-glycerol 3-phosphate transport system substrate-binding protein